MILWSYALWLKPFDQVTTMFEATYPDEAFCYQTQPWDGYDQDTQLIKMAKREPLEEFGRSLISCTLSEKLITGANFASTVAYFDQNYIMRTWTELVNIFKENGRMADKFKNKGYEDFTVKNIEVVQLPDRIVFRFQREFTKNSQTSLAKTESSLLVLYLK